MTEQQERYTLTTQHIEEPVQPTPAIVIEQVTQRHYVLRHTAPFKLYLTEAELRAVHLYAGDTCGSQCDCFQRGYEAGIRDGQDAGNLHARA